jgi:prepilin-type N-terminal cleavage/methylation domain-containing protein
MQSLHNKNSYSAGFTLMEVMVSVSIFAIIVTIGIGSLLTINTTLQKTRAERQAIDSLSYVLDTMTRQIRTGKEYNEGGSTFEFKRQDGGGNDGDAETVEFSRSEGRIFIEINGSSFDITPPNVTIDNLSFAVAADPQPYVTINISATVNAGRQSSSIAIQAGVSQRELAWKPDPVVPPVKTLETPKVPFTGVGIE